MQSLVSSFQDAVATAVEVASGTYRAVKGVKLATAIKWDQKLANVTRTLVSVSASLVSVVSDATNACPTTTDYQERDVLVRTRL